MILKPLRVLECHSILARSSIARSNSKHDRGSPWCTPLDTLKGALMTTTVSAFSYREFIVFMKFSGRLYLIGLGLGSHDGFCHRLFLG